MLKSLELFGFKSFADKTAFEFSTGITGVIGPNGSGKSNVVDAIKWILGDQSAKSLRGKEMTDVIFNGAANRKGSAFAEAALLFDNSSGFLPLETPEVQVGRRLWRNGDSEYLINRAPARLKDVRDLFMGTGAGSSAYCIIEQGRVDQILQGNPSSRRAVFEEAAGISRYKARKNEALRRLERVDQNLARLTDIVDEVEAQLNSVRSQAAKAAKFREISEELRRWWLGLAADDSRHFATKLAEAQQQHAQSEEALAQLAGETREIEGDLAALDGEISGIDHRLRAVEESSANNREAIAGFRTTIEHQTARRKELAIELDRLRRQQSVMGVRAQEISAELERARTQRDRSESEFSSRREAVLTLDQQAQELAQKIEADRESIEAARRSLIDQMRAVSAVETRLANLHAQQQELTESRTEAAIKLIECEHQVAASRSDCDRSRRNVDEVTQQVTEAEEAIRAIRERQETLRGEQSEFQRRLAEQREQRSAWKARKSVLEDLERRQEGVGIGVKEILSRARTSDYAPWNRIAGCVADLFEVDLENAGILEVALGERAQLVVLDEIAPLLEYLDSGACQISGRVGFLALANPGNPAADRPNLAGLRGIVSRADGIVRCPENLAALPERVLGDTWVVESLAAAFELAAGAGRGCRFVTLQGELLDADGTLTVGTVRSETALVSRKSELRRLKSELLRLDKKITDEERRLSEVGASLDSTAGEFQLAQSRLKGLGDRQSEARSALQRHEQVLEQLRRERDGIEAEIESLAAQHAEAEAELTRCSDERSTLERDLAAAQERLASAEQGTAAAERQLQALKQQCHDEKLTLAKHEERFEGLQDACRRLVADFEQRLQQRAEAERRLNVAAEKHQQITIHLLNTQAALSERILVEERCSTDAAALRSEKESFRTRRAQLNERETALRTRRRTLGEQQHRAEMSMNEVRHQLAALAERMQEEYGLTLDEVAQSGGSAHELYAEEIRTRASRRSRKRAVQDVEAEDDVVEDPIDDTDEDGTESAAHATEQAGALGEVEIPSFAEVRGELEGRVNRLRRKLKLMGSVNTDSLRDLDELESRYGHMSGQLQDLVEAKHALEDIVRRINSESKRLFTETFQAITGHFRDLFRKAFGGGDGNIVLEDPEDVLECGIDIVARPPGKELKSISLMSGGEKTLTAFALLLAMFRSRPSPYCVLDEVDAALDEANVGRLMALLEEFKNETQFIIITHKKPTMAMADVLHGVTMEESGVSKRMSVRFDDIRENGDFANSGHKAKGRRAA